MANKKIYLSPSNQPTNSYVVGNTNEKVQMQDVAKRIKVMLDVEYDCETVMATLSLGIGSEGRPKEAKDKGCSIYLAIHSNAGGGGKASGAVAFYHPNSAESKNLATNIVKELNAICPIKSNRSTPVANGMLPFNGQGYGEIRTPNQYGLITVLAETDFHDNPQTAQWIINSKDAIARAYVNALTKTFGISKKTTQEETPTPVTSPRYYRVQVGAYSQKAYAEAMLKKVKAAGFDAFIKYD